MIQKNLIHSCLDFLDNSPTAFHVTENVKKKLEAEKFKELKENEEWSLTFGGKYFVIRNDSSLIAFEVPKKNNLQGLITARITASHSDSPCFKLKPNPEFLKQNMVMLSSEVYGSPLLSSFLNRDLKIAGRVFYLDKKGEKKNALISLEEHLLTIPELAIHLNRRVNEEGLKLNKEEHLGALFGLHLDKDPKTAYLHSLLKDKLHAKTILSFDLFLVPAEKASLIGFQEELIASYRLDNLLSLYASLVGFLESKENNRELKVFTFFDHEEVGSKSYQGANSTFLSETLERMLLKLKFGREEYLRLIRNSLILSLDMAHALHPSYIEKHDSNHKILMNGGIVIKQNAKLSYAGSGHSAASLVKLCKEAKIPYQYFVSRNDIECGSTIGPLISSITGIETIDLGIAELSMHAAREVAATKDLVDFCHLMKAFYNRPLA